LFGRYSTPAGPASRGVHDERDDCHLGGAQDHQRPGGACRDRYPDRVGCGCGRLGSFSLLTMTASTTAVTSQPDT
jgi:hypothetical protein